MEEGKEINKKESLSRRGFLKAGLLLGLGALTVGGIEAYKQNEEDPFRYENFKELVGRDPKLYPGYYTYFEGQVVLNKGTKFYSKPTHSEKVLGESRNTFLGEISEGQEIVFKNPLIITSKSDENTDENWRMNVPAPKDSDGNKLEEEKIANFQATWIAVSLQGAKASLELLDKAKGQPEKIVFVRVADSMPSLNFLPLGETGPGHVKIPSESLVQANPLAIKANGEWDLNKKATESDRQSPWFGPGKTSDARYFEIGVTVK